MARNEHDGRSLEERLASLDAMSGDPAGPPSPEGETAPRPAPAEQENAPPQPPPYQAAPEPQADPNANPWLAAPPAFQGPPENFGPPQPPPYEGPPGPQPFDAGMLPPPYYPPYDPSQVPQPPYAQPQPQPQPQHDANANGNAAPPLDQLPPYPSGRYTQQDGPPPQYRPIEPDTGRPPAPGVPQFPPADPAAGVQEFPPAGPDTGGPYAPGANGAVQQPPPAGPNAGAQQFPPADPGMGQPYASDPNAQAFPPADPHAGGQPYQQVDPDTGQPYMPIDPNTGQLYQGYGRPPTGPQGQMIPPGHVAPPQQPQDADSLSSENLLGERRIAPSSGWRRAVYKATAGSVHPGESQGELRRKDLIARARTAMAGGHHRVAVMSLKGGVGKTTTTTGLGSMLGSLRGDRVIAVDANPDRGTLSDKVRLETAATVRDLLNSRDRIHRYADVRAFTSQNEARLEILASDRDPAVSEAFSAEDYAAVAVVLEQYYSVCITDCGTGLLHSAMAGVLSLADQLVLVSSPSVDGARSASATLDWLEAHDHGHLVRNGVVVLSMVRNRTRSQVDLDKLQAHFESRCRAVVRIPYDDHLEEGAEVELEQLAPATREAYLTLAAVVGDGFAFQRPAEPS